jgi:hypothetical protein
MLQKKIAPRGFFTLCQALLAMIAFPVILLAGYDLPTSKSFQIPSLFYTYLTT